MVQSAVAHGSCLSKKYFGLIQPSAFPLLLSSAINIPRFAAVVQRNSHLIPSEHQQRLVAALEGLLNQDMLAIVGKSDYEQI
jgi:hypothetical protein